MYFFTLKQSVILTSRNADYIFVLVLEDDVSAKLSY